MLCVEFRNGDERYRGISATVTIAETKLSGNFQTRWNPLILVRADILDRDLFFDDLNIFVRSVSPRRRSLRG